MIDPRDMPDEVRKLYDEYNGRASETHPDGFFYDCPECKGAAVCRLDQTKLTDRWLTHCPTEGCKHHGEQEHCVVEVDEDELERRKHDSKRFKRNQDDIAAEAQRFLTLATRMRDPESDHSVLLDNIMDMLRRYVFIGREEAIITTLWIAHTHCLPAAQFTPYIHLRSALPREGKSVLLELMEFLVARPLVVGDPTPAALAEQTTHRIYMSGEAPTMLWDEIDSVFERRTELREYLNLGFKRGAVIRRANKDRYVWGPKMIAGLTSLTGKRLDTIRDRSFRFDMVEAMPDELPLSIADYRTEIQLEANEIKYALGVLAEYHIPYLTHVKPDMPDDLDPRGRDISRPLIAIADLAGGNWPEQSRNAVVTIRRRMNESELSNERLLLLRDIRRAMGLMQRIPSGELVRRLSAMPESPWQTITQRKLALLLHEFSEYPGGPRITPQRMRVKSEQMRGYNRTQFRDVWKRYLPRLK